MKKEMKGHIANRIQAAVFREVLYLLDKDAASLAENVAEIKSINFGGIRSKEGSTLISKAIAISNDDLPLLHEMIQKSVELEVRQVPTDSKLLVTNLIKNLG